MNSRLAITLLLAAPALAHDFEVRIMGAVAYNHFASGPLAGVQVGDPVTMSVGVELPYVETTPGQVAAYDIDEQWTRINVGGVLLWVDPGSTVDLSVTNDLPADTLILPPIATDMPGVSLEFQGTKSTGTLFDDVDLFAESGIYLGSAFDSVTWKLHGGDLGITYEDMWIYTPEVGTTYCDPAVPNSTGAPGTIHAVGLTSLAANNLTLRAGDLPPGALGYFIVADSQGVLQPPGSIGDLCLWPPIARYSSHVLAAGSAGSFAMDVDLTALPFNPPVTVVQHDTWHFQCWYRDAAMATSNFTSAVTLDF